MERVVEEEWLDEDRGTPEEIRAALHSITRVNQRFGGVRLHARLLRHALARISHEHRPHILEVASGHADVLQAALLRIRGSAEAMPDLAPHSAPDVVAPGITAPDVTAPDVTAPDVTAPDVTLLDASAGHLPDPHAWPATLPAPRLIEGNALDLPLSDASVDIVSCCLFLHHLEPDQVMRFLAEAQRVARVAVVINDLERTALHYRLAQLNRIIDRSRISRHDGPVSVHRAYTRGELADMLHTTGRSFLLERAWLCRLGAILWCGLR